MSDKYTEAPDVLDVDFQKRTADKLYRAGAIRGINPRRIERIREDVRFDDVVSHFVRNVGDKISCPFHGTDSTPSFQVYRGSNDGFCFGCPAGKGYYDHIRFVKESLGCTWVAALKWIEKEFELPDLPDVIIEQDEDEEITTEVTFTDLSEPFLVRAVKDVRTTKDYELALEYIHVYFGALAFEDGADEAKKAREPEEATKLHFKAAMRLARVLGQEAVNRILDDKEL
jgi:hypothetical protein